jgi:hypothetical protein
VEQSASIIVAAMQHASVSQGAATHADFVKESPISKFETKQQLVDKA